MERRRTHERYVFDFDFQIRREGHIGWAPARSRDVSLGGVLIETALSLEIGDRVRLDFSDPNDADFPRSNRVAVVRHTRSVEGKNLVGLQLQASP